jgi:cysteine-rich repeat protein
MTPESRRVAWVGAVLLLSGFAATVRAECNPSICSGSPCTVSGTHVIDNGCVLDWSAKAVTIANNTVLRTNGNCNIPPDGDCPSFTIRAAQLTHRGRLAAEGGVLTIEVLGAFATENAGGQHGVIVLDAPTPDDSGGLLDLRVAGALTIGTSVTALGDGELDLEGCNVTVAGTLDAADGFVSIIYHNGFTASSGTIHASDNSFECLDDGNGTCTAFPQSLACTPDGAGDFVCTAPAGGPVVLSPPAELTADVETGCTGCGNHVKESGEGCDDGNVDPCDGCSASCQPDFNGSACDDGDVCTTGDVCQCDSADCSGFGTCQGGGQLNCDDGIGCTVDVCLPGTGCVHGPFNALCNDGNGCTQDTCDPTTGCTHGPTNCDDGNSCTIDSCDASLGCRHPITAACLVPILATILERCGDGHVDPEEECDDGNNRNGDCCSATCRFEPAGSSCLAGCSPHTCNGGGQCQ